MNTKYFYHTYAGASHSKGLLQKLFLTLIMLGTLVGIPTSTVLADPTLPLPRMPICGDQDGSETPFSFHCNNFVPSVDVQIYQAPGTNSREFLFDFVFREATYNNELGFFKVDDAQGTIEGLSPGDSGYLSAAFQRKWVIFSSGSNASTADINLQLNGGEFYIFFIIQNSSVTNFLTHNPNNDSNLLPLAFFSLASLNSDGVDHFVGFYNTVDGFTQFGFEDLTGGGDEDYDDVVYNILPPLQPGPTQSYLKPPLVIVHGWQGFPGNSGYHCYQEAWLYDGKVANSTLGALPNWFLQNYQVWIAHLESTSSGTNHLVDNAKCLRKQLQDVYQMNPRPMTVVAHSMGGLVSRAALYFLPANVKVKALYTLGSPHAGYPFVILPYLKAKYYNDQAALDMVDAPMAYFNGAFKNKSNIDYYFLGGDATPFALGLGWAVFPFVGYNDGFVGRYSSVGWVWKDKLFLPSNWDDASHPKQYWTDEVHMASWGNSYYSEPPGDLHSFSFECIKDLMADKVPEQSSCRNVNETNALDQTYISQTTLDSPVFTEIKAGHLDAEQSISIPLDVDTTSASLFYFSYDAGKSDAPTFTLTRPDGETIDAAYVVAHPSEVTYKFSTETGTPQYAAYNFNTTQAGQWQLNITTVGAVDYHAFVNFDSSLLLEIQTDKDNYEIGDLAIISANIDSAGIGLSDITVTAALVRTDNVIDLVTLADQGNGIYTNTYSIPDVPGYLTINVSATGNDGSTTFSRQENLLVAIRPNDLQLTNSYDDRSRDDNSDSYYDYLDFIAGVNLSTAGEYAVSAELYAGNQLITQSGDFFSLTPGNQTITLSFDGRAIYEAGLNGPYKVKNFYITPIDQGITAVNLENVWITNAYSSAQFVHVLKPQVSSITRINPNPTSSRTVSFTTMFSKSVNGVDISDFSLVTVGVNTASIQNVTGDGDTYMVTINTGSGNGTIRLDLVDDNTIFDMEGNLLGGVRVGDGDFTSGETYTVLKTPIFGDVSFDYWSWSYIERLYAAGITGGCSTNPLMYCPGSVLSRDQMAVFLLKGKHGASYVPPAATGMFADVPQNFWAAAWIEQLAKEGITSGCSVSPAQYCPGSAVTRDQMAVFLLKAKHGSGYVPPVATGDFADVPQSYWAAAWIEQLAAEGVTGGCATNPLQYCPGTPVTRDQMAVFLVKNFNLP